MELITLVERSLLMKHKMTLGICTMIGILIMVVVIKEDNDGCSSLENLTTIETVEAVQEEEERVETVYEDNATAEMIHEDNETELESKVVYAEPTTSYQETEEYIPRPAAKRNTVTYVSDDCYEVNEYDDPDDFAGEWQEEFEEGYGNGYDEAYDYWEDEYEGMGNRWPMKRIYSMIGKGVNYQADTHEERLKEIKYAQ